MEYLIFWNFRHNGSQKSTSTNLKIKSDKRKKNILIKYLCQHKMINQKKNKN